jgi:tRNA modification GTPase
VTERQLAAVRRALEGCREAQEALEQGRGEDLASEGLVRAQIALDELLSGGSAEDLYDRIFARFCIGK